MMRDVPFTGRKCAGCGEEQDLIFFAISKDCKEGRKQTCKRCEANKRKEDYIKNSLEQVGKVGSFYD